jgi:hypothetical protein
MNLDLISLTDAHFGVSPGATSDNVALSLDAHVQRRGPTAHDRERDLTCELHPSR